MVKCRDCAFLALKSQAAADYHEPDAEYRHAGQPGRSLQPHVHNTPICFAMAANLGLEVLEAAEGPGPAKTLAVIGADRECGKFRPWQIGYAPKEVAEMVLHDMLRKEAEERGKARAREDRAWREAQEAKAKELEAARDRREWRNKVLYNSVAYVCVFVFSQFVTWTGCSANRTAPPTTQAP